LLQPHIFLQEYSDGLEDTLHSYFALFKVLNHEQFKHISKQMNAFCL
jgi:hypothetical protein